eukprot:CAMPEP_0119126794 /NCGR_PEP_ID=MMETSP1310-20130426/5577_1 /TAXON_ID=464262 /ORGANISM="Genus nov. species nov., Strain RCC2339" /LENGTH=970 /DNA_ID=CAMNT_0007116979 /DNA_START=267 /DNA_END=3179 /DNA_ORIENTATION=+
MADDLENAIVCMSDEGVDPELRAKAVEYCNSFMSTPDGWKVCASRLLGCTNVPVVIYYLSAMENMVLYRYETCGEGDRAELRNVYLQWISRAPKTRPVMALRNIFCRSLIVLFRAEYPERWPTFFQDVFGLIKGAAEDVPEGERAAAQEMATDIFLRLLLAIDELVVTLTVTGTAHERAHNQLIKDRMKDDGYIGGIVNFWVNELANCQTNSLEVMSLSLEGLSKYVTWIDVNLVANDRVVAILHQLVTHPSLRSLAVQCLTQLVAKGMQPSEKLTLMEYIRVERVAEQAMWVGDEDFEEEMGRFVNRVGTELVQAIRAENVPGQLDEAAQDRAWRFLLRVVQQALSFTAHEYDDVSETCMPLVVEYFQTLKGLRRAGAPASEGEADVVLRLLPILENKMRYDPDFDFAAPRASDEEYVFKEYRTQLQRLFAACCMLRPEDVVQFLRKRASAVLGNLGTHDFTVVEGTLTLVYSLYGRFPPPPAPSGGPAVCAKAHYHPLYAEFVEMVLSSGVSAYQHHTVQLAYLDLVTRFCEHVPRTPEATRELVGSMLDNRGMSSAHPTVRGRAAYQFLKVCTKLKQAVAQFCLEDILKALLPALRPTPPGAPPPLHDKWEKRQLYEAMAILACARGDAVAVEVSQALVGPLAEDLARALPPGSEDTPIEDADVVRYLEEIVSLASHYMKGLSEVPAGVMGLFQGVLDSTVRLLPRVPTDSMRNFVLQLLHRAVETIREQIFPSLPQYLSYLLRSDNPDHVQRNLAFLNQLTVRFRGHLAPVAEQLFPTLTEATLRRSQLAVTPGSEEEREIVSAGVAYLGFVASLLQNNLQDVVLKSPLLPNLCSFLVGAAGGPDPRSAKMGANVLLRLLPAYQSSPDSVVAFVHEVVPALLRGLFHRRLDTDDPVWSMYIAENIKLQRALYSHLTDRYPQLLQEALGNLPANAFEAYMGILGQEKEADARKQMKGFLRALHQSSS